jgi:hypothetical protein
MPGPAPEAAGRARLFIALWPGPEVRGYALVESHPQRQGGYAILQVYA